MLCSKSPFEMFSRALHDGVFFQPIRSGELPPPPEFIFLVNNAGDNMISNYGNEFIVDK